MADPDLRALVESSAPLSTIRAHLDALPSDVRQAQANSLSGALQRRLWDMTADAPPITLAHFVPAAVADLSPVHHPGRNTIPVPRYFQRFQKRFARPADGSARLFGYNASNAWFIRPGYFVAYETADHPTWRARGGVVIDYHQVPDAAVPAAWPAVVPNSVGLQRLVYHRTRDFMRQVSAHVSIGRASKEDAKGDVELDFWFTLCRDDTRPGSTTLPADASPASR